MEGEKPLGSWKEISAYLQCSLRTCQRWEKELDLPIHRLDGTPKARVFAYRVELDDWLKGKLNHSDVLKGRRAADRPRPGRGLIASLGGLGILAAGAFIASRTVFLPWLPPPEDKPSLAVLPFENATGDKSLDGWKTAFPDLVITDLVQSRFVNTVRITDLSRALAAIGLGEADRFSDEDLRRIADRAGVDHMATGSIQKDKKGLVLNVSVSRAASGEAPRSFRADLQGEHAVFDAADKVSLGIRRILLEDRKYLTRDVDRDVRKVSTSSPEAFMHFSQGYRLFGANKLQEGIVQLQRAVELDPGFALAYKYLWRSCMNARREDDEKAHIRKAVELSGSLSERERGDLRILFYRDHEKDPAKERSALERLWRYHPDDRFGGIQLMSSYVDREEWEKALPVARKGLEANRKEMLFYDGLARCQANLGRIAEAEETVSGFIETNPDHTYWADVLRRRVDYRLLQGEYDGALADLETLTKRFPNNWHIYAGARSLVLILRGDLGRAEEELAKLLAREDARDKVEALLLTRDMRLLQGRIEEAKEALRQGLEIEDWTEANAYRRIPLQIAMRYELARLDRITGDLDEALKETDAALQARTPSPQFISPPFEGMALKALLLLEMDRADEFEKQVREIHEAVARQSNPKLMRICYYLLGLSELKKNNVRKSIDHLWDAIDLLSNPGYDLKGADPAYFYALAEAHMRLGSGDIMRALSMYEKVIQPSVNHLHSGDLYAQSFYRIARIQDRLASGTGLTADEIRSAKSKAVENYRRFLELWKDADPIFGAELEDARQRLAALGSD